MPTSAHPAFDKAGDYFGIKIVRIPVTKDFSADVRAMAAAITSNTIGLVGSAPGYPHGIVDDIPALAKLVHIHRTLAHSPHPFSLIHHAIKLHNRPKRRTSYFMLMAA